MVWDGLVNAYLGKATSLRNSTRPNHGSDHRRGRNGERDRCLKRQGNQWAQDTLCGQLRARQVRSAKCQDLECQILCFEHNKPGKGELDHGAPIRKCFGRQAVPALPSINEHHVQE